MSASAEKIGGWDGVRGALAEIGACHAELDRFLGSVFDDLDRMTGELAERHRQFAHMADGQTPAKCDTSLREAIESLHREQAEIVAALRSSPGLPSLPVTADGSLQAVLERLAGLAAELVQSQSEQKRMLRSQQALVSGELAAVRHLLEDHPAALPSPDLSLAAPGGSQPRDATLDVVLAQFERLEAELAKNRPE